jgi:hypothetical protein
MMPTLFGLSSDHSIGEIMAPQKFSDSSNRPKQRFGAGSMILIGVCVAVVILGVFIGAIVIYGGSQAVQ